MPVALLCFGAVSLFLDNEFGDVLCLKNRSAPKPASLDQFWCVGAQPTIRAVFLRSENQFCQRQKVDRSEWKGKWSALRRALLRFHECT